MMDASAINSPSRSTPLLISLAIMDNTQSNGPPL
jgi:hypothetical protein